MIILREYQQSKGVDLIRAAFAALFRAVLYVLPCGGGKSIILSFIAQSVAKKGNRVLIQCHRIELIRQLSAALDKVGCAHGIIAAGYKETLSDAVQLASVDTLARRIKKDPQRYRFDFLVTDESHHLVRGNKWGKVIEAYPKAKILGVTASPERLSGEGLGAHAHGYFDSLIVGPSVKELVAAGALVPMKIYAPVLSDLEGVKIHHGEYDANQSAKLLDKPAITGSSISHYKRICMGKRAMVFAANVTHSRNVATEFNAAGIPAAHVDADTPKDEREKAMRDFQAGRLLVLVNVNLFTEGVDCPDVAAVIMLRRTASLMMFIQMAGRAARPAPGKTHGILIDHVSNTFLADGTPKHGSPDWDREWSLDGRDKKKKSDSEKIQRMRMCLSCFAANPAYRTSCEQCNAPFEAYREPPTQVEGELVEISEEQKELMRSQQKWAAKQELWQARTREQLEVIRKREKYNPRWVDRILAYRASKQQRRRA